MHPGGIKTAVARNATAAEGDERTSLVEFFDKQLANTSPQKAARIILDGVRKNKARILVGTDAKLLDMMVRVTGPGYQRIITTVTSRAMPR